MKSTIYLDREDAKKVEDEEKSLWVRYVLENLGLEDELEEIWLNTILTTEEKVRFRDLLEKHNVHVVDNGDRGLVIYYEDTEQGRVILGTWRKPTFVLKRDNSQIKRSKKLFLEMTIDCESIFDEENND